MLIFGLGYTASRMAAALKAQGWRVDATGKAGNLDFGDRAGVEVALRSASHVLSSVPPERKSGADPVLEAYGERLDHGWIGYLSSTGVYGDAGGAWVDETSATIVQGRIGRRSARAEADAQWLARGARVFRLPGIYGPGRNVFERLRAGTARRIALDKEQRGHVFSRVHVDDIVAGVVCGLEGAEGAYNLADDLPASGNAVIEEACRLKGYTLPPLQSIEEAGLSPMARGFYAECRRVANGKAKRELGWSVQYPTYHQGLRSLL